MKKFHAVATLACLFALGACSVTINDEEIEGFKGKEQSLDVRSGDKLEIRISCTKGRRPYKEGGENGESIVMGCR